MNFGRKLMLSFSSALYDFEIRNNMELINKPYE